MFGFAKKKEAPPVAGHAVTIDGATHQVARQLDCLGDSCPRPQLVTKKAVAQAAIGDVIEVKLDNPSSVEALPPMCDEIDATHLGTVKGDHCWLVYIRKD